MTPKHVRILKYLFGPGPCDIYEPVFDEDGKLVSYPDLTRIKRKMSPTHGGWRNMPKKKKQNTKQ